MSLPSPLTALYDSSRGWQQHLIPMYKIRHKTPPANPTPTVGIAAAVWPRMKTYPMTMHKMNHISVTQNPNWSATQMPRLTTHLGRALDGPKSSRKLVM